MNFLFDLDGTLTDPLAAIRASLRSAFQASGLSLPDDKLLPACIGPPLEESLQRTLGVPASLVPKVVERYRKHQVEEAMPLYRMFPEAAPLLERWQGKARLFVATSKAEDNATLLLKTTGYATFFEAIYGSRPEGSLAHKPDLLRHLLEQEQLDAHLTLMIGDRHHDMAAARANGLCSIGVLWGFGSRRELEAAGATHIVGEWGELEGLLERLEAAGR